METQTQTKTIRFKADKNAQFLKSHLFSTLTPKKDKDGIYNIKVNIGDTDLISIQITRNGGKILK